MNPLARDPGTFVVIGYRLFARSVEDTVDSVFFLVVEYVMMCHAVFVFWSGLELLQLFGG